MELYSLLIYGGLFAVTCVLVAGLWTMMRGHKLKGAASLSQRLMRWRVGLQFITIVIVMAGLYLTSQ